MKVYVVYYLYDMDKESYDYGKAKPVGCYERAEDAFSWVESRNGSCFFVQRVPKSDTLMSEEIRLL